MNKLLSFVYVELLTGQLIVYGESPPPGKFDPTISEVKKVNKFIREYTNGIPMSNEVKNVYRDFLNSPKRRTRLEQAFTDAFILKHDNRDTRSYK